MQKRKILATGFLALVLIGMVFGECVITLNTPTDLDTTSIQKPDFKFHVACNGTLGNAWLNLSGKVKSDTLAIGPANGTYTINPNYNIEYNKTSGYVWSIIASNRSGNFSSGSRTLYVKTFGTIEALFVELPNMFSGVIGVILPVVVVILLLVILGFVTGFFGDITNKVKRNF